VALRASKSRESIANRPFCLLATSLPTFFPKKNTLFGTVSMKTRELLAHCR
jgi:hypothetical protein